MEKGITWVGLDAHKSAINVAMYLPESDKPVEWQLANEAAAVRRMVRKVERQAPGEVRFCYEAGPCGYSLQRQITEAVLDDYLLAIEQLEERVRGLDERIEHLSHNPAYAEAVGALRCFRGIDAITATIIVTELYSFGRFTSPRGLMAFLGLVPSEHSSSDSRRQGAITKAGNGHVRRVFVEAAWHYRHRPSITSLKQRREGQPTRVVAIADRAMLRLHRRFNRMKAKGIPSNKVAVAVARELVGFVWAALQPAAV